jgi:hypothetical protein
MPGTPACSSAVTNVSSGVFAIVVGGACLATLAGAATPAQAASSARSAAVPVTAAPAVAMPGLPVTFTIGCGHGVKSATLYGSTVGLPGPVAMKSTRAGGYAVTVSLPTGIKPGVYLAVATCESGDYGTTDLTVNGATQSPSPTAQPTTAPPTTAQSTALPTAPPPSPLPTTPLPTAPLPTAAPVTGDGATSIPGGIGVTTLAGVGLLGAGGLSGLAAIRRFRSRR